MFKFSKGKKGKTDEGATTLKKDDSKNDQTVAVSHTNGEETPTDTKSQREEALENLLDRERKYFKRQLDEVSREMLMYKAENEKLRHEMKHGNGMQDDTDKTKKELDHQRSTNRFLIENIERRKQQISKLETDVFQLDMKLQAVSNTSVETERRNQELKEEMIDLLRSKMLVDKLLDENQKLRHFLSINKLDSRTGKRQLNHVIKRNQKSKDDESGSITERSEAAMTNSIGQRPNAYLGLYTDIQRRRIHKN